MLCPPLQRQILRPNSLLVAVQDRHGALKAEARFASVPRIEEERAVDGFAKWFVRVAEDHHVRAAVTLIFFNRI